MRSYTLYRNYTSSDNNSASVFSVLPEISSIDDENTGNVLDWSRSGYNFIGWNTASNGTGTTYQPSASPSTDTLYAKWEEAVSTPDVEITYKGAQIASMSATGVKTLLTGECFCEDDIVVSYTKPSVTLQSKTVAPTTSQQTVSPDNGYDGLSSVTVSAISPTKAAQTYTPTTTNQTIPSGRYLTGTQTILGDANLLAENIKKDVVLFGITGTYEGGGGGAMLVPLTLHPNMQFLISSKTFQEIKEAYSSGQPIIFAYDDGNLYFSLLKINSNGSMLYIYYIITTGSSITEVHGSATSSPLFPYQSL